ncbi:MOSC domain protein [Aspergillus ruber CBS 135680]|uniref:MOSC domain-containing protein n=1 Tax=Aspergillus ruber (strain CBS 135680) TaxID=1388766 RepID=A0A017SQ14_ASPRC|nr:uncharacterized protein EURHEDRAFT_448509 [Aspergillus ruber CBS 135680]EYE98714.1 hypothetical protein EURHEDRAFT_448509 [Aspergillus ruber CBS 135680]
MFDILPKFQDAALITILCILPLLILNHNLHQQKQKQPQGCRKLNLPPEKSNLHDEHSPKYAQGVPETHHDPNGKPSWRIKALFTYPIKSCAGVELNVSDVVPTGLKYDRQFCFAEYVVPKQQDAEPYWTARTLRDKRFERMALIRSEVWVPDSRVGSYAPDLDEVKSEGVMVISYPRTFSGAMSFLGELGIALGVISKEHSFQIPLSPPPDNLSSYPNTPVKIWKDFPMAYNYAHHLPSSLYDYLGFDSGSQLTLFRVNPSHHREIFRCAPPKQTLGFQTVTGFADAYPIHLLSLSSVRDVGSRCADIPRLSIRRFRANIIVQGPGAFEEDHWKRIGIGGAGGGVEIHTVCRTVRCRLPNVDPDTGVKHPSEPDRTLRGYRRIDPGCLTYACLGMQLVPAVERFRISVDDPISVLETGEHFYIKMLAPGERVPGE